MSSSIEASEETPLIHAPNLDESEDAIAFKHEQLYKRFSPTHKRIIVAIVSWSGLIPCKHHVHEILLCKVDDAYVPCTIIHSVRIGVIHAFDTTNCEGPTLDR